MQCCCGTAEQDTRNEEENRLFNESQQMFKELEHQAMIRIFLASQAPHLHAWPWHDGAWVGFYGDPKLSLEQLSLIVLLVY